MNECQSDAIIARFFFSPPDTNRRSQVQLDGYATSQYVRLCACWVLYRSRVSLMDDVDAVWRNIAHCGSSTRTGYTITVIPSAPLRIYRASVNCNHWHCFIKVFGINDFKIVATSGGLCRVPAVYSGTQYNSCLQAIVDYESSDTSHRHSSRFMRPANGDSVVSPCCKPKLLLLWIV